jgi:hypothetical protein
METSDAPTTNDCRPDFRKHFSLTHPAPPVLIIEPILKMVNQPRCLETAKSTHRADPPPFPGKTKAVTG